MVWGYKAPLVPGSQWKEPFPLLQSSQKRSNNAWKITQQILGRKKWGNKPPLPSWTWEQRSSAATIPMLMLQKLHFTAQHGHEMGAPLCWMKCPSSDSVLTEVLSDWTFHNTTGRRVLNYLQHNQESLPSNPLPLVSKQLYIFKNPEEQNRKWQQIDPLQI